MKKKHIIWLLLPVLSLLACTRDVVLKLDPVTPLLVLNASVTPGHEVAAFLSKSWFLLDSVPEYDLPDQGVSIEVYVNDTFRGTMQRSDNPADSTALKGQFRLPGCYVQSGDRVRLEAQAPHFAPVMAETIIPEKTEIAMIDTATLLTSDYYSLRFRLYLTLKDNPDQRNYYRLIVERLIEYHNGDEVTWESSYCNDYKYWWGNYADFQLSYDDPVFQPSIPSLSEYDGAYCHGVFSDDLFNGKEYTVTSSFFPDNSMQTDTSTTIVHYDIHLLSISEAYYNYLKVIRNFTISLGDAYLDGLLEPTATYSNVTDGFGVVTGYQTTTHRITMPFKDTITNE